MIVKITSKRQVTLPAHVLEAMGVGPGDRLEIQESADGFLLKPNRMDPSGPSNQKSPDVSPPKPRRIDYSKLGILKDLIPPDTPPFDIREFRDGAYDSSLRD